MYKIVIIMSTYNGAKYLREQLDSIINQTERDKFILIRDDGSTDETLDILEEYQKKGLLKWYKGKNLRSAKSLIDCLRNAPEAKYYAIADQDDYWKPEKLEKALEILEKEKGKRILYCSNLEVVDKDLNYIDMYHSNKLSDDIDYNLENIVSGNYLFCGPAMVFDKYFAEIIKEYKTGDILCYDRWYLFLAAIAGKIVYDNNAYIKYRQHNSNTTGFKKSRNWKERFLGNKIFIEGKERYIRWNYGKYYCKNLLKDYNNYLDSKQIKLLKAFINFENNFMDRLYLIFNKDLSFGSLKRNIYIRLMILLGKN